MPAILHRLTIDAPPERVHDLIATTRGIEQWWTGRSVAGDGGPGRELSVSFAAGDRPAATFAIVERSPSRIVWRCVAGPEEWRDTRICFALRRSATDGTTLLFDHEGWKEDSEFMHGCSTNWAEGRGFHPYPDGEISRWE